MSIILHTKRLLLRPMRLEDAEGMFELNNGTDIFRNTGDQPFSNIEEVTKLIGNYDQYEKYQMGRFTIIDSKNNEYVGWCGLKYHEERQEIDLGYRLLPKFRGKGIATEAAEKCLEYGFKNLAHDKIIGRAIRENPASIAILRKLGMSFEKEFYDHNTICEQYYITNEQWMDRMASQELQNRLYSKSSG